MTIEEIKELLRIFNESGVAELEVQRGGNRVRIRKASGNQEVLAAVPAVTAPVPAMAAPVVAAAAGGALAQVKPADAAEEGITFVKSPIVGTFYEAPAPGAPSFVKVGDSVEVGQVLCIIESMKLMNEIEAETPGVIVSKLVENGRPVEYGEALFGIRPR